MADYPVVFIDPMLEVTWDEVDIEVLDDAFGFLIEVPQEGGGSTQTVVNRVWDTVAADFVRWSTSEIDSAGASYPGPGTFGVDTSDYVVETIQFTRA
jgi:hypothetical protein